MKSSKYLSDMVLEAAESGDMLRTLNMTQKRLEGGVVRTRVHISSEEQSRILGKPRGVFYTFESENGRINKITEKSLTMGIKDVLVELSSTGLGGRPKILVACLGNAGIAADALGPRVAERLIVTRPLFLAGNAAGIMANVSALSTGVFGATGIESADVIRGVVKEISADLVVTVDTLAAGKAGRLFNSFQVGNAGITPGSGVGNRRTSINFEELGIPVLSVGVPLALYAGSLIREGVGEYVRHVGEGVDAYALKNAVTDTLKEANTDMIVTPKAIDELVDKSADIIAGAINLTFNRRQFKDQ